LSGEVFDLASISDNCDKQANYNMPIRDAVIERKRERAAEEERRRRRRGFGFRFSLCFISNSSPQRMRD